MLSKSFYAIELLFFFYAMLPHFNYFKLQRTVILINLLEKICDVFIVYMTPNLSNLGLKIHQEWFSVIKYIYDAFSI